MLDAETLAKRHGFTPDAVREAARALRAGGGAQAQFSHPEFGGHGQWQSGMIMIGDMFNHALKARVAGLFADLVGVVSREDLTATPAAHSLAYERSGDSQSWYPASLGTPSTTGAQNDVRYAFFPGTRRLAVELRGRVTVYDTGEHRITGVSQSQTEARGSLTFTTGDGVLALEGLAVVRE